MNKSRFFYVNTANALFFDNQLSDSFVTVSQTKSRHYQVIFCFHIVKRGRLGDYRAVLFYVHSKKTIFAQNNTKMKNVLIAPSVLAADFGNLQRDVEMINQSKADWFHIDIMDGVFVPNISFGMPVLEAINKHAQKTIDVHLMIIQPERYIKSFAKLGANILTVHYEASTHLHRTLQEIKAEGMKAGVALNPHTNVAHLEDCINDIDLVCLMSVNPGFGGQSFIENTYKKVKQLKEIIARNNAPTLIEIDGGVTSKNAKQLVEAGADVLVAGSFVFNSANPIQTIEDLKNLV